MRAPVDREERRVLYERDGWCCRFCGRAVAPSPPVSPMPANAATVDHILARSLGGTDADENLVTSCASCNAAKALLELWIVHRARTRRPLSRRCQRFVLQWLGSSVPMPAAVRTAVVPGLDAESVRRAEAARTGVQA